MKRKATPPQNPPGDEGDFTSRLLQLRASMDHAAREAGTQLHDFEGLRERLCIGLPDAKIEAARFLRHYGPIAVEPLCLALRDANLRVRTAAAQSLGELEDPRALPPLVEALRSCFAGRSARYDFWVGVVETLMMLSALALTVVTFTAARGRAIHGSTEMLSDFEESRQERNDLVQAITTALAQIGERHPSPELRGIIPDLKIVARDVVQQRKSTREASRSAAARIEALTARLQDLPVPVTDSSPIRGHLPFPAIDSSPQPPASRDQ